MPELTFVGLSDDGSSLLLSDGSDTRFTVAVDDRLAASVRRDRHRSGPLENSVEPLRPKDVQARIRGGATAEEVAEESGWDLDHVRRYEGPPLAERAWIAEQARAVEVRRPEGDARLDDLVAERLGTRGIAVDDLRWDAWRRDDGRWTVLLAYPAGQGDRVATWVFDTSGRTLHADDDEGRWLIEEPTPPAPEPTEDRPRLVGLPTVTDDDRHDTIPVVRPLPAEVVTITESVTVTETVEVDVEPADGPAPVPGPDADEPAAPAAPSAPAASAPAGSAPAAPSAPAARGRGRRAKRSSVPSWDEILFGASDREE